MKKILAINGSYRDDGITDQAVNKMLSAAKAFGAEVELILCLLYTSDAADDSSVV